MLKMNSTFSAFQIQGNPTYNGKRKHLRLMKSMTLPDDTLEYWGFYLPQGSTVNLSVCSRYLGIIFLFFKAFDKKVYEVFLNSQLYKLLVKMEDCSNAMDCSMYDLNIGFFFHRTSND